MADGNREMHGLDEAVKRGVANERARRERQAAELRANLKRRKSKARGDAGPAEMGEAEVPPVNSGE